ncbi:hypothetical protein P6166_14230 [Stenotrophomonas sp. HITSZ_GD]|uniref:hypothetical protein n=1 Tax=Stenotrophomonas sp. HITSZ_GD TaxID=3037248 RepID=UPI00240D6D39|nr:hypothetical protein [Stenotrophomonas sp. HITSZ_GD]MDG2526510.1 hypothetical protein [Stenotrophomonas sp. HITSZ_GD]
MNVALPALIVFLIVLPGFIARSQIKLAESEKLDYSPFGAIVVEGLVWAAALHAIWLLACALAHRYLDLGLLLGLLSSSPALQSEAVAAAQSEAAQIAWYFGTQLLAAVVATPILRWQITRHRWDRSDSRLAWLFRFRRAPWYYLLSGADFAKEDVPDLISVAAVINVAGEPVLYVGTLEDYYFDSDGKLDRLVLEGVERRPLSADKSLDKEAHEPEAARFYRIEGDYFVIRYEEVISLNVRYIRLADGNAPALPAHAMTSD